MLTTRRGTAVVVGLWLMSWVPVYLTIWFAVLPIVAGTVLMALIVADRITMVEARCGVRRSGVRYSYTENCYLFPFSKSAERHNQRARMLIKADRLLNKKDRCESLINELSDPMKIAVLEGERDAADREAERIREDVKRLEAFWKEEDRQKRYDELTG